MDDLLILDKIVRFTDKICQSVHLVKRFIYRSQKQQINALVVFENSIPTG